MQIPGAAAPRDGFVQNRAPLHLFPVLPEIPDMQALGNRYRAVVRLFFADDHAEKRSLARAVGTYQAHLFTGVQLERSVDEDQLLAILLIDIGKRDHSSIISESLSTVAQF